MGSHSATASRTPMVPTLHHCGLTLVLPRGLSTASRDSSALIMSQKGPSMMSPYAPSAIVTSQPDPPMMSSAVPTADSLVQIVMERLDSVNEEKCSHATVFFFFHSKTE